MHPPENEVTANEGLSRLIERLLNYSNEHLKVTFDLWRLEETETDISAVSFSGESVRGAYSSPKMAMIKDHLALSNKYRSILTEIKASIHNISDRDDRLNAESLLTFLQSSVDV
jgi:hypothetical protein